MVALIQGGIYSTEDKWVYLDKTMDLPEGVVLGGIDSEGYYNYVGRVASGYNIVPARVVPELGKATFNSDILASQTTSYEVLVGNATVSYHWIRSFDGFRENNAVPVGTNASNDRVYICRARYDGGVIIGTLYLARRKCMIQFANLNLREFDKYEILVRERHDKWVIVDKTVDLPEEAVFGGFDPEGYYNYVGRVIYSSNVLPARVVPELGRANYNTDTLGNQATSYEVLVGNATVSYHWIRSFDGFREKNAVSVGTNAVNDRVFICRVRCDEALFIGTLYLNKRMCIVKHENLPLRQFDKYEILVRE
ncbi:hypothetical protein KR038_003964, partial [Drosophila bunnanda]